MHVKFRKLFGRIYYGCILHEFPTLRDENRWQTASAGENIENAKLADARKSRGKLASDFVRESVIDILYITLKLHNRTISAYIYIYIHIFVSYTINTQYT